MKIMFVFAHPDDESFSSGGTIAKLSKREVDVKLITATRGEAGQTGNPEICKKVDLGMVREQELRQAAKILGISQIYLLGYIDGTLNKIEINEITGKILVILKKEKPDAVITFNEEGGSKHPDHIQINKSATSAFKGYAKNSKKYVRLYYTVFPRNLVKKLKAQGMSYTEFGKIRGTLESQITTIIDIRNTLEIKIKAIKSHKTQRKDWERFLKIMKNPEYLSEYFRLVQENNL